MMSRKPIWRNSAPYAFALTFDLDRIRPTYHRLLKGTPKGAFWNFSYIQKFLRKFELPATLFVLDQTNPLPLLLQGRLPDAFGVFSLASVAKELKKVHHAGMEIAIHGNWGTKRRADLLYRQRERLAQTLSIPIDKIRGNRQHYLDHDGEITFRAEVEAGLTYDASVGSNYRSGYSLGHYFPYFPVPRLVEIPLAAQDTALFIEARHTGKDPLSIAYKVLSEARVKGGIFQICHHCRFFRPGHRSFEIAQALLEEAKRDGAWIATLSEIAACAKQC